MGKSFEKGLIINFGSVNKVRKVKVEEKVRELNQEKGEIEQKRLKLCKKWLTHDHKSENHTVVAC